MCYSEKIRQLGWRFPKGKLAQAAPRLHRPPFDPRRALYLKMTLVLETQIMRTFIDDRPRTSTRSLFPPSSLPILRLNAVRATCFAMSPTFERCRVSRVETSFRNFSGVSGRSLIKALSISSSDEGFDCESMLFR